MEAGKLLLTVTEAAEMLSLGRTKVYELVKSGALPSVRIDGSRRVRTVDVRAFVDGLGEAA